MSYGYPQGEAASYQGGGAPYQEQNHHEVASNVANQYADEHDRGLFSSVLSNMMGGHGGSSQGYSPAEQHEIQAAEAHHQQIYGNGQGQGGYGAYGAPPAEGHSPQNIGTAAAVQAVKYQEANGGSGKDVIGMAMSEALKLFKSQGGQAGGDAGKSQAMQQAASMAMKLFMAKQGQSGGGSGGLTSMVGMLMSSGGSSQHGGSSGIGSMVGSLMGGQQSSSGNMAASLMSKFL